MMITVWVSDRGGSMVPVGSYFSHDHLFHHFRSNNFEKTSFKNKKKWIIFYSCHGLLWFRQPLWVPAPVRSLTTMSGPLQTWEKNFRRSRRTADRFVTRTWHQPARGSTTTSSRRRLTAGPSSKVWPWTRPWWRIPWKEKNTRRPNFVNLVGSCEISSPTTKELR